MLIKDPTSKWVSGTTKNQSVICKISPCRTAVSCLLTDLLYLYLFDNNFPTNLGSRCLGVFGVVLLDGALEHLLAGLGDPLTLQHRDHDPPHHGRGHLVTSVPGAIGGHSENRSCHDDDDEWNES